MIEHTEFYYFAIRLEKINSHFKKNSALMNDEQRTQTISFALRSSFRLFAIIFILPSVLVSLLLAGCSLFIINLYAHGILQLALNSLICQNMTMRLNACVRMRTNVLNLIITNDDYINSNCWCVCIHSI